MHSMSLAHACAGAPRLYILRETDASACTPSSDVVRLRVRRQQHAARDALPAAKPQSTHEAADHKQRPEAPSQRAHAAPASAQAAGPVVSDELLLLAPLRHPLQLLPPHGHIHGRRGVGGGVHLHLRLRGHEATTELGRRQRRGVSGLVREGALAGKGVVQPLGEETPMQGHLPSVGRRDLLQLRRQGTRPRSQAHHDLLAVQVCVARHVPNDFQQHRWLRDRRAHRLLDLAQDLLAIVSAADEVVRGRDDAIRGRLDVVRDDDLLPQERARLVQRAQLTQVGLRLAEAPVLTHAGAIEL
mmetsp:Transcript_120808/g.338177  ORF Transcript_120808/g.338177 Transcript_120808/m.338177 type:complete len:300 (-) Transcript_120808:643-1542(-)